MNLEGGEVWNQRARIGTVGLSREISFSTGLPPFCFGIWDGQKQKRRGQMNDHAFAQSFTALIYRDTPPSISSFLYVDRDRE